MSLRPASKQPVTPQTCCVPLWLLPVSGSCSQCPGQQIRLSRCALSAACPDDAVAWYQGLLPRRPLLADGQMMCPLMNWTSSSGLLMTRRVLVEWNVVWLRPRPSQDPLLDRRRRFRSMLRTLPTPAACAKAWGAMVPGPTHAPSGPPAPTGIPTGVPFMPFSSINTTTLGPTTTSSHAGGGGGIATVSETAVPSGGQLQVSVPHDLRFAVEIVLRTHPHDR